MKVTTLESSPAAPPELVVAHAVSGATVFVSWGSPAETMGPVTYHVWRSEGGSWDESEWSAVCSTARLSTRALPRPRAIPTLSRSRTTGDRPSLGCDGRCGERGVRELAGAAARDRGDGFGLGNGDRRLGSRQSAGYRGLPRYALAEQRGRGATLTPSPTTATTFKDDNVSPYRRYWYTVAAVDASGAVGVPSAEVRIRAVATTSAVSPHASFTEPGSDRCRLCHATHQATSDNDLLVEENSRALCDTCHDGTGAATAVNSDLTVGAEARTRHVGRRQERYEHLLGLPRSARQRHRRGDRRTAGSGRWFGR